MTVTLTYEAVPARVKVEATGLAAADTALVQRSTNQLSWTTVRGALAVPVTAGVMTAIYDYEFVDGVPNFYRVRGVSSAPISFVAAGAASSGADGTRGPLSAPAGIIAGDVVYIWTSTRNVGVGSVNVPTGWTLLGGPAHLALLGRVYDGVWSMPSISYAGGATNETTIGQSCALRNAALVPVTLATAPNAAAQNIAYPGISVPSDGALILAAAWKQDDWTSVATLAGGWTEIQELATLSGNDGGQVWDYLIQTTKADVPAGAFVVTGGASAVSRGLVAVFEHAAYLNEQSASVTPTLDTVRLKSVTRPFLNRSVRVAEPIGDTTRPARNGGFPVVGRTDEVAVTDGRLSGRWTLTIRCEDPAEATLLEYLLASGDVLLVQVPIGSTVPGGYVEVADTVERRAGAASRRLIDLPLKRVAPPGPEVEYALATWTTVFATYGDWATVAAAFTSWQELLDTLVGDPSEVVV